MTTGARRLGRSRALAVSAALAAGVAAVLVHGPPAARASLEGRAVVVRATLNPRDPQFGDTVMATVRVLADPAKVDVRRVQVRPAFAPFAAVASSRRIEHAGGVAVLTWKSSIRCLSLSCAPQGAVQEFSFGRIRVSYRRGPAVRTVSAAWPALRVHSRVTAADAARPVLRVPPPVLAPPRYRVSPHAAGYALLALAALLAVGGAALLLRVVVAHAAPARRPERPLDRALLEVAASCSNGDSGRRRRALEDLARELEPIDEPLSVESRVLAWGRGEPQPDAIFDLADRVRTVVHA